MENINIQKSEYQENQKKLSKMMRKVLIKNVPPHIFLPYWMTHKKNISSEDVKDFSKITDAIDSNNIWLINNVLRERIKKEILKKYQYFHIKETEGFFYKEWTTKIIQIPNIEEDIENSKNIENLKYFYQDEKGDFPEFEKFFNI